MRILGVRAAPKEASFVVYCTDEKSFVCIDYIKIPLVLDMPEKLKFIRNNILDILREYNVSVAGIRVTESNAQNLSIERLYIEGVLQEALSSSNVSSFLTTRQKGICSRLGIRTTEFKDIVQGNQDFRDFSTHQYSQGTIEAILTALSLEDA
ncbi:hypothetical protein N4G41_10560 [Kosakonia sacchari]|uniref:hypothetical protein n=1 Tax=Kosakonia sacchari TaxID=1158459 RepID=UPI002ACE5239|nr:hypothetical protein [Kosakonia sacchari]MDZ7322074.1 hypothetical protein [Kosakonia sacchari]